MPKLIENVREQLLEEAKRQIIQHGYGKTTIRSIASACGLGVGTVYNYFKSKDVLIASFMLEDWQECLCRMKSYSDEADSRSCLVSVYDALKDFIDAHEALFSDMDASKVFSSVFAERHGQLREQLAEVLRPLCERTSAEDKCFLADFVSESLLTWTVSGKSFEEIYSVLKLILK